MLSKTYHFFIHSYGKIIFKIIIYNKYHMKWFFTIYIKFLNKFIDSLFITVIILFIIIYSTDFIKIFIILLF